jgi:hypothetical protein
MNLSRLSALSMALSINMAGFLWMRSHWYRYLGHRLMRQAMQ